MVPNVTVPMNFGKSLLTSPTHNNLVLNTSKNKTVKANSVILSFNSPVISNLTGTLHMTSVDMLEFDREAVQLFVEAAYSGTVEDLNRALFRDVNKICAVFKVDWMTESCVDYFKKEAESVTTAAYPDLLFLFEEAAYMLEEQKSRDLVHTALERIEVLQFKQQFIDQYLENAERLSTRKLDLVIELAGSEVNYIVQTLTNQLTHRMNVQGPSIPVNTRYLLDNSNLSLSVKSNRNLFHELLSILEDLSTDFVSMKWAFQLHKRAQFQQNEAVTGAPRCNSIPNLYHNMPQDMSYDELVDWVCTSKDITNLLLSVEAVSTWNRFYLKFHGSYYNKSKMTVLLNKISEIMDKRGWLKLPYSLREAEAYMLGCCEIYRYCVNGKKCDYVIVGAIDTSDYTNPLTFLSGEGTLVFHFKPPDVTSCKQPGHCGFILKTVPRAGKLRTLELCTESKDYNNTPVHFHDCIRAENMHIFCVDILFNVLCPLSWFGGLHSGSNAMEWWEDKYDNLTFKVLYRI